MAIEFKKKNYCYIGQEDKVKIITMGNIVRVKNISHCNKECQIIKLSNNMYKDKKTGKIKKCKKKINNRSQGDISLGRTRRELRDIITTNCGGAKKKNCIFVTLTYKEVMQDTKKLDNDLNIFIKKFRYHYGKDVQYIMLPAPQIKRKKWSFHIHCIFIFKDTAPFIENSIIQDLWGHGITHNKCGLYGNVDNLGAYLVCHLTDMPLDEVKELGLSYNEKDIKEVKFDYRTGKELEKACLIVKGIRTKYYPPHFKVLRKSRGLDKPIIEEGKYYEARKKVDYRESTSQSTLKIKGDKWSTTIKTEDYNLEKNIIKITSEDEKMINRRIKEEKQSKTQDIIIEANTFNF